ncbi:MAG: polyphosphate kinase 2 family protein [Ignavibacteriaceae bacterium]
MKIDEFRVPFNKKISLSEFSTNTTAQIDIKKDAEKLLKKNIKKMAELQDKLYAHDKYGLLLMFQAMDAAGKDGGIKHVMSGLNPQGTQVYSFKQPSTEELDHDYLWRINKSLPERGRIGIFNRSYYEEVLVVRLYDLLDKQKLPADVRTDDVWERRFRQICDYERYLYENAIRSIKFFLHLSKDEQKKRFLRRIDDPTRNWKFSASDLKERQQWDNYQGLYSEALSATSTKYSPWYVIPADNKWFARLLISEIVIHHLEDLKPEYPKMPEEQVKNLASYREALMSEDEKPKK